MQEATSCVGNAKEIGSSREEVERGIGDNTLYSVCSNRHSVLLAQDGQTSRLDRILLCLLTFVRLTPCIVTPAREYS